MGYITAIETAVPAYRYTQEELRDFYLESTDNVLYKRKIKIVSDRSGINARYSVLGDFKRRYSGVDLFDNPAELHTEPSLTERMLLYKNKALPLALDAVLRIKNFENIKGAITHVISVTCTGLFAPGLDIELIRALDLNPGVNRSAVNFMGCNAAILALKQADEICNNRNDANVLIVCVELCTIHFQKRHNDDYILSNLIFSDGAAAIMVASKPSTDYYGCAVKITSFHSLIIHNGFNDMAWQLSETGFIMNLTSYVSGLINENIKPMLDGIGLKVSEIHHWAIHPGGKRILDDFCSAVLLDRSKLSVTYETLKNYGNMSSPTVLFVLKKLLEETSCQGHGQKIFAAAFGPGISIETAQLQYV
ncbi:MAG: type III polyketide synthase [Bacteroidota bacterium]